MVVALAQHGITAFIVDVIDAWTELFFHLIFAPLCLCFGTPYFDTAKREVQKAIVVGLIVKEWASQTDKSYAELRHEIVWSHEHWFRRS